jgi:hypothetical protein
VNHRSAGFTRLGSAAWCPEMRLRELPEDRPVRELLRSRVTTMRFQPGDVVRRGDPQLASLAQRKPRFPEADSGVFEDRAPTR